MSAAIHLGTSGWTYDHWKDVFYPESVPKKKWFEYFNARFGTVELNASFYRIPTPKAVESWSSRSPEDFRFAVKMSRLVSHIRKLKDCRKEIEWFFSVFESLERKIAIFLVQLPPSLKFDPQRLDDFFQYLNPKYYFAFEFRNATWYRDETYEILRNHNASFCIHDMGGLATEKVVTSEKIYIRFHGFDSRYGGDYPDDVLHKWAQWIKHESSLGKEVFGYFNNDIGGYAVKNCLTLRRMTGEELRLAA